MFPEEAESVLNSGRRRESAVEKATKIFFLETGGGGYWDYQSVALRTTFRVEGLDLKAED